MGPIVQMPVVTTLLTRPVFAIWLSCTVLVAQSEDGVVISDELIRLENISAKDNQTPGTLVLGYSYSDNFERKNADTLGNDWLDCKSTTPDSFEPLGIYDNGVVVSKPFTRPGKYDDYPWSQEILEEGLLLPGIGCAYRDTGTTTVSVKVTWSGNFGAYADPPLLHVEGTPLLYITPDSPRYGFGAWISELYGYTVVFAGYIASPPEHFEVIATATLPEKHTSGEPREIELRTEKPGLVTIWIDGKQVSFHHEYGLKPIQVDPSMVNSTLHGFAVDAHLVHPRDNIPITKSIESIMIEALN